MILLSSRDGYQGVLLAASSIHSFFPPNSPFLSGVFLIANFFAAGERRASEGVCGVMGVLLILCSEFCSATSPRKTSSRSFSAFFLASIRAEEEDEETPGSARFFFAACWRAWRARTKDLSSLVAVSERTLAMMEEMRVRGV